MNLTGKVRNLPNGSVEIEAQGPTEDLQRFIQWAHHGPADAVVESVMIKELDVVDTDSVFEITQS